jgi:hypothetical protein
MSGPKPDALPLGDTPLSGLLKTIEGFYTANLKTNRTRI